MNNPTARTEQPRNPLHGVTLEAIVRSSLLRPVDLNFAVVGQAVT